MGRTGDPPVPVGKLPTGMEEYRLYLRRQLLPESSRKLPPGQWPGGTGKLPVLPCHYEISGLVGQAGSLPHYASSVQGFNARTFSGKSLPKGEGQGEGKARLLTRRRTTSCQIS